MIDAIITLIRGSESADAARTALMVAPFEFSEVQARYILDLQLRRLAALERQRLARRVRRAPERRSASSKRSSPTISKLRSVIKDELGEVRDKYGDERRTLITHRPRRARRPRPHRGRRARRRALAPRLREDGPVDQFRTQGRGGKGVRGGNLRDEDYVEHLLTSTAHSYLLFFSNRGRVYRLRAHEIPMKDRTARGTALVNLVALQPDEHIEAVIDTRTYEDGAYLFFATRNGMVKKTRMSEYDSSLRTGLDRDQPERRRRAGPRHPDERHRRRVHGVAAGHDDPLLRSRRAPDGPGHRRCAGHEAEEHRRRCRQLLTWPATTRCCSFVSSSGHGKRTPLVRLQPAGPGWAGRAGHAGHRGPGPGDRRVHRRARRRDPAVLVGGQPRAHRVPTKSPSRAGTRPGYASPVWVRAIRVVAVARVLEAENGERRRRRPAGRATRPTRRTPTRSGRGGVTIRGACRCRARAGRRAGSRATRRQRRAPCDAVQGPRAPAQGTSASSHRS